MSQTQHICDDTMRPATYWVCNHPLQTICCGRTRQAKNCMMQGCLDHASFWCAPSKGCHLEKKIEAERQIKIQKRNAEAQQQQVLFGE